MLVYFSFVIPIVISLILFIFFRHKTVWWEIAVPMVISVLLVLLAKWICVTSLTDDTEWLGGYVINTRYYEPWDEEVPCRHPIPCSHPEYCKDKDGKEYQCGYKHSNDGHYHPYDVDYHSEYWMVSTTLSTHIISESTYDRLVKQFGTGKVFVDQHRDYHSIDGDMYQTDFDGDDAKLEPVVESHSYENRPKASSSIYRYEEVDTIDIKTYKPFEYPEITRPFHQRAMLGHNDSQIEHRLQVLNSRLGKPKQIKIFLLVFENQPRDAAYIQERYWEGGNKNELIVCIGTDNSNKVTWGHVISWTEETAVKIKIKNQIEKDKDLNLNEIVDTIETEANSEWVRKPFHDFDYLNIEPTTTQVIWVMVITLLVNVGISVWVVMNEFEVDEHGKPRTRW